MSRLVAPSVLAIWDKNVGDYDGVQAAVKRLGMAADWVHVDVMDGVYVPAKTFGVEMVEKLRGDVAPARMDVHLMVMEPEKVVADYVRAGAGRVVFHPSVSRDVGGALEAITKAGAVAGLALDADEDVELLVPWAQKVQQVLVMTVKAGAGGQSFQPELLAKVRAVRELMGKGVTIVVDGGVKVGTAGMCWEAGVDAVVAGSAVFGSEDWTGAIEALKKS